MSRRLITVMSIATLVLYGSMAASTAATPATAATTSAAFASTATSATTTRPATHRDCVAKAAPPGSSAAAKITCYATFADAVRTITNGRVRLPASAGPGSVTPDEINPAPGSPDATFVLSVDYQNANFGGNTLFWTESSGCGDFETPSMPSGWNDVISSVANSSGCASTLYQNNNFTGTTFGVKRNASAGSLGSFNDEASSQAWCPGLPC